MLQAQQELNAGRGAAAVSLLVSHRRQFPESLLAEEASLLHLRALVKLKRYRALAEQTTRFLHRFPRSPKVSEVQVLLRRANEHLKKNRAR